ncbi:MAG: tRNA (adenosine(37)-N6)-dimethylallyltransferase MiaA, partial [Deltaproteobacteria bacterium]|nr:tRNA (adenosine(37)-N6)-dimethylallyltransferase MiaA [Deltaproteobacteria bacterium]
DQPWNAALFAAEADRLIQEIQSRKKMPFVVGGTGLHVKALLYGLFSGPAASKEIRDRLEKTPDLYGRLLQVDPVTATRVHPNDPVRIIRALEVFELTGKPISAHQEEHGFSAPRYHHLKIGLRTNREELNQKIEGRVADMIRRGLEGEVKGLLDRWGEIPLLARAIGYKEWFEYFKNKKSREVVIEQIVIATRQFAKRQEAWFRKEKDICWFEADDREGIEKAVTLFLGSS